ncbi:MAG: hypothetical protein LCH81_18150 [Bacteroidetes bacterium]|nr:hypothetical protein [Bacteroidota bacterium]
MNLTNTQFVFQSKTKSVLIGGMVLGALCLILTFIGDDEYHTRFWTNYLHNTVFFTGIAFTSMFFLSAQITAFAGWDSLVKRVWESMSQFMMVGLALVAVLVIGVWGHFHHLYHWNTPGITDPSSPIYDHIIAGKSGFLNAGWYTLGTLGFLAVWFFWSYKLRQASVEQDTEETASLSYYKKQRKWAASFLPLGGFLSTVFIWQSVMSIDPHWYSTMFAWYSMISMWLGGLSMTVMLIIYLKSLGYLEYVTRDHLHDIGKYLFGISVFWTYLWFDQFMLIWYANNGEETIYFKERMNHYPVLFWGNLLLNFVTPFLILMRNDTKRKFGTMFFVALIVFFGHWWDYFYMIKPGARIAAHEAKEISEGKVKTHEATSLEKAAAEPKMSTTEAQSDTVAAAMHAAEDGAAAAHHEEAAAHAAAPAETHEAAAHGGEAHGEAAHGEGEHGEEHGHEGDKSFKAGFTLPGFLELGTMIGFLSLFLFFFFNKLSSASLVPWKDPYLEESMHHETGALINTEVEENQGHDDHH